MKGATISQLQKDSGFAKFDVDKEGYHVTIKGRTEQLAKARECLNALLEEIAKLHRSIPVNKAIIPVIIGKGGEKIKELSKESGAQMSFDKEKSCLKMRADNVEALDKAEELIRAVLQANQV